MANEWVHINKVNGTTGKSVVSISCDDNDSYYQRTARVVFETTRLPPNFVTVLIVQQAKLVKFVLLDNKGNLLRDKNGNCLTVRQFIPKQFSLLDKNKSLLKDKNGKHLIIKY